MTDLLKITELLSNQDARLQLMQRELELHNERIKEAKSDLDAARGVVQDSAQRLAVPIEQLKYFQIQLNSISGDLKVVQERLDRVLTWKIKRESQIGVWAWLGTLLGGSALVMQITQSIFNFQFAAQRNESPAKVQQK